MGQKLFWVALFLVVACGRSTLTVGGNLPADNLFPPNSTSNGPQANANGPYVGTVGVPISFAATASEPGVVTSFTYQWAFGDGATSTSARPSHAYSAVSSYNVMLTVTDQAGRSGSTTTTVQVTALPPPGALQVSATATPQSGSVPLMVSFTGLVSGGKTPYAFAWSFGDSATAIVANPIHTYNNAGTYQVTLTVTDAAQQVISSPILTITVTSPPPPGTLQASASATPINGSAPLTVQFMGSASGGSGPTHSPGCLETTGLQPERIQAIPITIQELILSRSLPLTRPIRKLPLLP